MLKKKVRKHKFFNDQSNFKETANELNGFINSLKMISHYKNKISLRHLF